SVAERLAALVLRVCEGRAGLRTDDVIPEVAVLYVAFHSHVTWTGALRSLNQKSISEIFQHAAARLPEEMLATALRIAPLVGSRADAATHLLALGRRLPSSERNVTYSVAIASVRKAHLDLASVNWMVRLLKQLPPQRVGKAADVVFMTIEASR